MIAYEYPYPRPSWLHDLRAWLWLSARCWLAAGLLVGFSAGSYLGLFLAVRAVL